MLARILSFLALLALVFPALPASAQATPYEINVILALSGAAAFIGTSEQTSLELLGALTTCLAVGPLVKAGPVDYCFSPSISPPAVKGAESTYFDAFRAAGVKPNSAHTLAWTRHCSSSTRSSSWVPT